MNTIYGTDKYKKMIEEFYEKVHLNCDFKNNRCTCARSRSKRDFYHTPEATEKVSCCCGHCAIAYGYLHRWDLPAKLQKYYDQIYDKDLGFYRPNVGCILERKYRSGVCNTFFCSYLRDHMTSDERESSNEAQDIFYHAFRELGGFE